MALPAARMLLLLLAAGDLTETDEDNRDDDESVCGEGEDEHDSGKYKPREDPKTLNNRRNKLIGKQWMCSVLLNRFEQLI